MCHLLPIDDNYGNNSNKYFEFKILVGRLSCPVLLPTQCCSPPSTVPRPALHPAQHCSPPSAVPRPALLPTQRCTPPNAAPHPRLLPAQCCSPPSAVPRPVLQLFQQFTSLTGSFCGFWHWSDSFVCIGNADNHKRNTHSTHTTTQCHCTHCTAPAGHRSSLSNPP